MINEYLQAQTAYIFTINVFLSVFLTGLIWVIQLIHYPLFLSISRSDFRKYESRHQQKTGMLVAPVMVIDLAFSFLLLFTEMQQTYGLWLWLAFILNLMIFVSTLLVYAPLHQKLAAKYSVNKIKKLVKLNYYRTVGWTARSLILIYLLKDALK